MSNSRNRNDTGLCAAHAIKVFIDRQVNDIAIALRRESRAMLEENNLSDDLAGVTSDHTFNVEAISRVMRRCGFVTSYINVSLQDRIAEEMILSDGSHWLAATKRGEYTAIYTNNLKKIFFGDSKATKRWLIKKRFNSGLEIVIQKN